MSLVALFQPSQKVSTTYEIAKTPYTLSYLARYATEFFSKVMELVEGFFKMAPKLLTSVVAFKKFVHSMDKLLNEKMENYKCLLALSKENKKLMALSETIKS